MILFNQAEFGDIIQVVSIISCGWIKWTEWRFFVSRISFSPVALPSPKDGTSRL